MQLILNLVIVIVKHVLESEIIEAYQWVLFLTLKSHVWGSRYGGTADLGPPRRFGPPGPSLLADMDPPLADLDPLI